MKHYVLVPNQEYCRYLDFWQQNGKYFSYPNSVPSSLQSTVSPDKFGETFTWVEDTIGTTEYIINNELARCSKIKFKEYPVVDKKILKLANKIGIKYSILSAIKEVKAKHPEDYIAAKPRLKRKSMKGKLVVQKTQVKRKPKPFKLDVPKGKANAGKSKR